MIGKKVKSITQDAALLRAADLCARSEQCEQEIREKLRRWGLPVSDHDGVINYLIEHCYIDETRFACAFTNDKVRFSGWGRIKIRMALQMKKIPSDVIDEAIKAIDEKVYVENLRNILASRAKRYDLSDFAQRTTVCRQVAAKGYESGLIMSTISELLP